MEWKIVVQIESIWKSLQHHSKNSYNIVENMCWNLITCAVLFAIGTIWWKLKKLSNSTFKQHFFEWNCLDNGSLYLTTNETATKNQNKHWERHSRPLVPLPQIITSWSQRVKSMRKNQLHLKKTVGFSTLELMEILKAELKSSIFKKYYCSPIERHYKNFNT